MRVALAVLPLLGQLLFSTRARAERAHTRSDDPWSTTLAMTRKAIAVGECSAVSLTLTDPSTKAWPRGPNGAQVSMADFDLTVAAPAAHAAVGQYDGPSSFRVCACPKAPIGTVATVTATYPSQTIASKTKVPGVSFATTVSVPIIAGASSGNPPGCDADGATTVASTGRARPWTATIQPPASLPIGSCGIVSLTLRDSSGKDWPRTPTGNRVVLADFDLSVTASGGSDVAGKYDGGTFAACACQSGRVGERAAVTASYPARALAAKSQVPGVAFTATAPFTLAAARGSANPAGCGDKQQQQTIAQAVPLPPATIDAQPVPVSTAPVLGTAQPTMPVVNSPVHSASVPVANLPAGGTPAATAPQVTRGAPPELSAPVPVASGTARSPIAAPAAAPAPALVNPTGFTAVERGGGGVDWKWQAVPGAVKYRLDGTGLPSTGYFTTGTQNAYPHIPAGPGSWKVTAIYPGNLFDTASGTPVSLVIHVLPVRSQHWITKNNGAGSLAQVQVPANPFDPEHPCTPMMSSEHQSANNCDQSDINNHTVNQGVFPGDLSSAPFDTATFRWMDATSVDNWVKNGFRRWLDVDMKLWVDQFQDQKEAVYGNPLDLGVGRRSFCAQELKGPPHPGLKTVCYATAHGAIPGTPGFNDSATITHPGPGHGDDFILAMMIIKDPTGTVFLVSSGWQWVVPTVKLDTEGPKYVPFACISCHGGTYNTTTRKVDNSSLLPLDPGLLSFASASDKAAQEEKIRNINLIITRAQPNSAIAAYLNGLYHGSIAAPGTVAQPDYVPSGWTQQAGFYRSVVRPYCAMCHLAAPASWNFATLGNFLQNKDLIYADVCAAHIMPHAEVPFKSFWTKNTGSLYLPGLLAATIGKPSC